MLHDISNLIKPMQTITGDIWYNPMRLLSFGRPWMFSTGSRSIGKSTNIGAFIVLDYLYNGVKFFYLRRTEAEIKETAASFFAGVDFIISRALKMDISIEYKKGAYYLTDHAQENAEPQEIGRTVALSKQRALKSGRWNEYGNIIYDEFIVDNPDGVGYLGNREDTRAEYRECYSLYVTVDRGIDKPYRNETRMFFIGNTATIYNPIYLCIGAAQYVTPEARFIRPRGKQWIIEQSPDTPPEAAESFAFSLSDKRERLYTFSNNGDAENNDFIAPSERNAEYIATLKMRGIKYALKRKGAKLFLTMGTDPTREIIALDNESFNESDLQLIDNLRGCYIGEIIITAYRQGSLFFSNKTVKHEWLKYLRFT